MRQSIDPFPTDRRAGDIEVVCPKCRMAGSHVAIGSLDELRTIEEGAAACPSCGSSYPVLNGIPILVPSAFRHSLNSPDGARMEDGPAPLATCNFDTLIRRFSGPPSLAIGCGTGARSSFFNGDVVFMDTNYRHVREAVERYVGSHEVFGVVADPRVLPFPPDCFSYVLCSHGLGNLSSEDASLALRSMIDVAAVTIQVSVITDKVLLALARKIIERTGLNQLVRGPKNTLLRQAPLSAADLSRAGFEVHRRAHWLLRDVLDLRAIWEYYDALSWRLPTVGGTFVATCSKEEASKRTLLKSGFWRGDRSMVEIWDETGARYDNRWRSAASQALSEMELGFIGRFLELAPGGEILDIGVGTGRILDFLLSSSRAEDVYGVDLSEEMLEHCRAKLSSPKLRALEVADVSSEDLPFEARFDFMTAVRVLPYCRNWREVISKVAANLRPGGILVFSMPNLRSINRFTPCPVPVERATKKEIEQLARDSRFQLLDIESFTRLPDVFYDMSRTEVSSRALLAVEALLRKLLGRTFLGRFLFVALRNTS